MWGLQPKLQSTILQVKIHYESVYFLEQEHADLNATTKSVR